MGEDQFFEESWVMKFLQLKKKTLQCWRSEGKGPRCIGKGTVYRYPKKEFWEWYLEDEKKASRKRAS